MNCVIKEFQVQVYHSGFQQGSGLVTIFEFSFYHNEATGPSASTGIVNKLNK